MWAHWLAGLIPLSIILCCFGLSMYAHAQGSHPIWGAAGLVPWIGPLIGLLWLTPVLRSGRHRGLGLTLLRVALQGSHWYRQFAPFVPVSAIGPLIFYTAVCVTGFAFYAGARRRHPGCVVAGLVPIIEPLVALVALTPRRKNGKDSQPPTEQPTVLRFAYGMLGVVLAVTGASLVGKPAALTSLSPDKSLRVQLVPKPQFLDINFRIQVQRIDGFLVSSSDTIFHSPDEGGLQGRFVWAKDGSRFVLDGQKFFVNEKAHLPNGEKLYLMYDARLAQVWCNSPQQKKFPPFSEHDLQDIEWNAVLLPTRAVG